MNRISLMHQAGSLYSYFPNSSVTRNGENEIIWVGDIIPTPISETYKVKLHYRRGEFINVFVLEPKLRLADGEIKLPHVYSTARQELCLYYPKEREWHAGLYYVHTLIPWTSEWLLHYEIWVGTGKWHGGGIDHNELHPAD